MKPLLLFTTIAAGTLFTACDATFVERRPIRSSYVERDVRYRSVPRRDVVVYDNRPGYYDRRHYRGRRVVAPAGVRYYNDGPRRYYMREGRRIYVDVNL